MRKLYRVRTVVGPDEFRERTFGTPSEAGAFVLTMIALGLSAKCDEVWVDEDELVEN